MGPPARPDRARRCSVVGAVVLPLVVTQPSRHLLYTTILALRDLRPVAHRAHRLGRSAVARPDGLRRHRRAAHRGVHPRASTSTSAGATPGSSRPGSSRSRFGPALVLLAVLITAGLAALIGAGALRVRGLLARGGHVRLRPRRARSTCTDRPILSGGFTDSVPFRRTDFFGLDLTSQRTYYYVVLAVLVARASSLVARLRRTGVGRTTIAVRDNPDTAAAYTVSTDPDEAAGLRPRRRHRRARRRAARRRRSRRVPQRPVLHRRRTRSLLVAIVVIGGLGLGRRRRPRRALGDRPARVLPRQRPRAAAHLEHRPARPAALLPGRPRPDRLRRPRRPILDWVERRLGPAPAEAARTPSRPRTGRRARAAARRACRRSRASDIVVRFGGIRAVDSVSIEVGDGEIVGPHRHQRRRQVDADERHRRLRARRRDRSSCSATTSPARPPAPGPAGPRPHLPGRHAVPRAHRARDRAASPSRPGSRTGLLVDRAVPARRRSGAERATRAEADELIDFLGLGRYADAYIADLSTGTRRIVELAGLLALDARRALPRRADRRRRPARDRGVRPAHPRDPPRARRVDARHRARHAADHEHQRPGVLPRARPGHRRGRARRRCATTPPSSPATSAPTSGPSPAAVRSPTWPTSRRVVLGEVVLQSPGQGPWLASVP